VTRKPDKKYHGTQLGTTGSIEARLREYGKPDGHTAPGPVLGALAPSGNSQRTAEVSPTQPE